MTIGANLQTPAIPSQAGLQADAVQHKKLADGAREFEAMLLGQMLKPLHFGATSDSGDDEEQGAAGTVQGMATEALAKGIAAGGGLGLAHQILQQVGAEREAHRRPVTEGTFP